MNLKEKLIKLGSERPELQKNIRPVLAELEKSAIHNHELTVKGTSLSALKHNLEMKYLLDFAESIEVQLSGLLKTRVERDRGSGTIHSGDGWSLQITRHKDGGKVFLLENGLELDSLVFPPERSSDKIMKQIISMVKGSEVINPRSLK